MPGHKENEGENNGRCSQLREGEGAGRDRGRKVINGGTRGCIISNSLRRRIDKWNWIRKG